MKKILIASFLSIYSFVFTKPKVTIVLVIDQFAAHYINKLDSYLQHGIHHLLKNGIVYVNTNLPYGATATAVGHTSLSTGALPKDHGVICNAWLDDQGNKVKFEDGYDARHLILPTLNKPFLEKNSHNKSISLSIKGRAALGMAGKKAPAIWLNESTGNFQTNNNSLIIDQLLTEFNERLKKTELSWQQFHTDPNYYDFPYINNYDYAEQAPIVNSTPKTTQTNFVEYFSQLPSTNKFLLDMAVAYLKKTYTPHSNEDILIWVSLSSLDKIGHLYGPYAKEVIDMIYHLDYQIEQFMKEVAQIVPRQETLYVLTADHGIMPIPELAKKEHPDAKRINTKIISAAINNEIKKNFGISDILIDDKIPHIYLNKKITKNLSSPEKERLLKAIQEQLEQIPGIKRAYTNKELEEMRPQIGSYAWHLKNNIYPGRSGNLLLEIEPYVLMSKYKGGTKHNTPHPYNTHVPLILYQPTVYEHKTITQRVWMPQIAATLAKILEINSPSSQALPPLPIS